MTEASSRAPWVARVARFGGERWGVVAGRAIRLRSVVSCLLLFATALSATSGVALYVRPEGSLATWTGWSLLGLDKQDWEAVHSVAVVFFLLAATWHLVLNWRPLLAHFRIRARRQDSATRLRVQEPVLALAVVVLLLVGTLRGWAPLRLIADGRRSFKGAATALVITPPAPDAETLTLRELCPRLGVGPDELLDTARRNGVRVDDLDQTLADVGATSGLSPQDAYRRLAGK